MDKCPHCGNDDSYSYKVYGIVDERTGSFENPYNEESVELHYTRAWPIWAKCDKCGKRIRLTDIGKPSESPSET